MRLLVLPLVVLPCAVFGDRVQSANQQASSPVQSLASLLLSSSPAAAWQVGGVGVGSQRLVARRAASFPIRAVSPTAKTEQKGLVAMGTGLLQEAQTILQMRLKILKDSQDRGDDFKQTLANMIAGEYDEEEVRLQVNEIIDSAPAVMFSWESSPSCKKAKRALEMTGANVKIARLDAPWDEGNPQRAELGRMVGRTSVPFVFIGGKYVGGFDGGIDEDAPGIVDMAFKGTLQPALKAAGAMATTDKAMSTTVKAPEPEKPSEPAPLPDVKA